MNQKLCWDTLHFLRRSCGAVQLASIHSCWYVRCQSSELSAAQGALELMFECTASFYAAGERVQCPQIRRWWTADEE